MVTEAVCVSVRGSTLHVSRHIHAMRTFCACSTIMYGLQLMRSVVSIIYEIPRWID